MFRIKVNLKGRQRFHVVLTAKNGRILNSSETLENHKDAFKNILSVLKAVKSKERVLVFDDYRKEVHSYFPLDGRLYITYNKKWKPAKS